jgi:DsbC/DsbD-like thiol-disulfide interchange protein
MTPMRLPLALFALLLGVTAAGARAETGADHVKVDLLADTTAVQAGKPFTVGVRFKIDAGWHIYWTNPGDSGLPTRVKLDLPAGYTAGPVRYPVPQVLKYPGDITNYGYESEVTLLVTVTPPAVVSQQPSIVAHADYLVCSEVCLPGHAAPTLTLPAPKADAEVVDRWISRLPSSPPIMTTVELTRRAAPADDSYHIQIQWPADAAVTDVQWLPPVVPGYDMTGIRKVTAKSVTEIDYKLTAVGHAALPEKADSLVVYKRPDGSPAGFTLTIQPAQQPTNVPNSILYGGGS